MLSTVACMLVCLVVPQTGFATPAPGQRQHDRHEAPAVPLSPVTVTATRVPVSGFDVPASVSVVGAGDIVHGAPGPALAQTLARVPGVVAQTRQSYAQDLQISIRGFGARASFGVRGVRLLMDGLPLSLPDGQGETDAFDLAIAQRIEVLRGPFATLYGNGAGGVIQIFTRDAPPRPTLQAHALAGSHGMRVERLDIGGTAGKLGYLLDVSSFHTDGWREHSAAKRRHLYTKWRYAPNPDASVTLLFNAENQPWAQDPSALTKAQVRADPRQAVSNVYRFDAGEHHRHRQGGLVYAQQLGDHDSLHATAWLGRRRVWQLLPFAGAGMLSGGAIVDLHNRFGGGGLRWTRRMRLADAPLVFTLGVDYERLHEDRKGFVNDDGRAGSLRRDEDDVTSTRSTYLQWRWRPGDWVFSMGLRHARVAFDSADHLVTPVDPDDSGARHFSATDPVWGVLYKLTPEVHLYVDVGRGFQTPTLSELAYRPDGAAGPNLGLGSSTSNSREAGLKARLGARGRLRLTWFGIHTDSEIVTAGSVNGRTTYRNAGTTRRKGLELYLHGPLGGGLDGTLAWTRLAAEYASGPFDGKRLPGVPRRSVYAALRWRYAPLGFHVQASAQWRGRVYVDDHNTAYANSYLVTNIEAGFRQEMENWRWREFVRIDNLFDRHHIGAVVVNSGNGRYFEPAPGRSIVLGVSMRRVF